MKSTRKLPEFLAKCRVRHTPLSLSLAKRQKLRSSSPEVKEQNRRALQFGVFGAYYEKQLEQWSNLAEAFYESFTDEDPPSVKLFRCGAETILVDFYFRQIIHFSAELFKTAWPGADIPDFRLIDFALKPEEVTKLRGVWFVPRLTRKLISVHLQLQERFHGVEHHFANAPERFVAAVQTGLRSYRDGKKLCCLDGNFSVVEIQEVLAKVYPHIHYELSARPSPFFMTNIPDDKRNGILGILGKEIAPQPGILYAIFGTFGICRKVYEHAPAILLSYSSGTELLDFFASPPARYDLGIYIKLHAIARHMQVKAVVFYFCLLHAPNIRRCAGVRGWPLILLSCRICLAFAGLTVRLAPRQW